MNIEGITWWMWLQVLGLFAGGVASVEGSRLVGIFDFWMDSG